MQALVQAPLWRLILDATIFSVTGIALSIVGYYIWELVTPYNLRRDLQENKNLAVAVIAASLYHWHGDCDRCCSGSKRIGNAG